MNILITGSEGCIGKELVAQLRGVHELHLWDKKVGMFDLAIAPLSESMRHAEPEIVFHLAASFERTKETPEAFDHIWHNDTLASHRLLEAIKTQESVKTVVFASSYLIYEAQCHKSLCLYPDHVLINLTEYSPVCPRNLCGMSKLYTERELEFLCSSTRPDIRFVNARIFRVYGLGSKSIINAWCSAKIAGSPTVVFNEENRFDFIHARDVAEGLKRLAFTEQARGIVNLGTGRSRSIKEVYGLIGLEPERIQDDPEWEASVADVTKLKGLTGWTPQIQLEDGIKEILEYEQAKSLDNQRV